MRDSMKLSGVWKFALDPQDVGLSEKWWERNDVFNNEIMVPGAWQAQGFGDNKHHTQTCQSSGFPSEGLQFEKTSYLGTGWYRRTFTVPSAWKGRRILLRFGGINPKAEFWLDGQFIGEHHKVALECILDLTEYIRFDMEQTIVLRISECNVFDRPSPWVNTRRPRQGSKWQRCWVNPITNGTFNVATWSGLYRDVILEAIPVLHIKRLQIFPDIANQKVKIKICMAGKIADAECYLRFQVFDAVGKLAAESVTALDPACGEVASGNFHGEIPMRDLHLWSPESPYLYHLTVALENHGATIDSVSERFGMREFEVRGKQILINGHPVFLRGYGNPQLWAYTLSPYLDRTRLEKEIKQARDYGFNFVNFLASIPHKEFLDVADKYGLLVQYYPTYQNMNWPSPEALDESYVADVIGQNFNHPCVMIYSVNAEIYHYNPEHIAEIRQLSDMVRRIDSTRLLITVGGIRRYNSQRDDTDIYEWAGGGLPNFDEPPYWNKPIIMHEFYWWSSYPNPALKYKYEDAAILPFHIEYAEKIAAEKGLSELLPRFVENSEKIQAIQRKTGCETARRIVNGYSIWFGKDFKEAVEGIWDDFGDPKNVSAEEFRKSNGNIVVLIDRASWYRCYWNGETITVAITVSNQSSAPLVNSVVKWQLVTAASGTPLAEGHELFGTIDAYSDRIVHNVGIQPRPANSACKVVLHMELMTNEETAARNNWPFWLFPQAFLNTPPCHISISGLVLPQYYCRFCSDINAEVLITNSLNSSALDFLENGGRVFYVQNAGGLEQGNAWFGTIPWNSLEHGSSGTLIDMHPALADFPHDGYCDLQFYNLIQYSPVIILDNWPVPIRPIIRCIDSYKGGRNQAYLFETTVGRGALLITTLNLFHQGNFAEKAAEVEGPYLLDRLLRYVCGKQFIPEAAVSRRDMEKLLALPTSQVSQSVSKEQKIAEVENI
ncbi:MAG: glycoside hydrolase family 2 TIM barrel-domain containing protein [Victivallaceae bacterium]|nr:glycoside hydrolase family 2 TIM barrel-domain containing protein [Victivallaceae bacterium]